MELRCRREQRWPAGYLCLPVQRPESALYQPGDGRSRRWPTPTARREGCVRHGVVCDYDRDGWLDVYITTNLLDSSQHPNGQRGYLFHNNRNGTFTDVTDRARHQWGRVQPFRTWWDYDNDGGPIFTSPTTTASPTSSITTTGTARSPMSSIVSCHTPRSIPWARTLGT